jgi:hypothetical protein
VTDLVREASFADFRDALHEVWPDLPEPAVARAWRLYNARVRAAPPPGAPVPRASLGRIQSAFSKRDLPMRSDQAEALAIEILKGWA